VHYFFHSIGDNLSICACSSPHPSNSRGRQRAADLSSGCHGSMSWFTEDKCFVWIMLWLLNSLGCRGRAGLIPLTSVGQRSTGAQGVPWPWPDLWGCHGSRVL